MNTLREYILSGSPLRHLEHYAAGLKPFLVARTLVHAYYFFLLFISVGLFKWDTLFGAQTQIVTPWSIAWFPLVSFTAAYTFVRVSFIAASVLAAFAPQWRIARVLSFLALLEFCGLYLSILQLDMDGYGLLISSFLFIFLPARYADSEPGVALRMRFLLVFFGVQAANLLTYSMGGIGKLVGAVAQISSGSSNFFSIKAAALHIADRMIVTNTVTPLGPWAVDHYLLIWPYFLFTLYLLLCSFVVAFRPQLHRTWGMLLVLFHIGNYLVINIGFVSHLFLWSILLIASPFAPEKQSLRELLRNLPLVDVVIKKIWR